MKAEININQQANKLLNRDGVEIGLWAVRIPRLASGEFEIVHCLAIDAENAIEQVNPGICANGVTDFEREVMRLASSAERVPLMMRGWGSTRF